MSIQSIYRFHGRRDQFLARFRKCATLKRYKSTRGTLTLVLLIHSVISNTAFALDCADADPYGVQSKVLGNWQLHADPDDVNHNLIYINHTHDGPSQIVVAQIDSKTGIFNKGSLTIIADNFQGRRTINGPEFVYPPGLGLGLLYRGRDGVHGVFRSNSIPKPAWNAFNLDISGRPTQGKPPRLPSTSVGSYDYGGLQFYQNTYALYRQPCSKMCFADMRSGIPTDVAAVFEPQGLFLPSAEAVVQGTTDGDILAYLCTKAASVTNKTCGLYSSKIDKRGGFTNLATILTNLPLYVGAMPPVLPIAVQTHPSSKANIVFVAASTSSEKTIDIYQQENDTRPLFKLGSFPVEMAEHFRIVSDGKSILVLNFLVRTGGGKGSYVISVSHSKASGYTLKGPTLIQQTPDAQGRPEVEYFPAINKFAIYYRISQNPSRMFRCFFDP